MPAAGENGADNEKTREKLRERLREGKLDERIVEVEVKDRAPSFEIASNVNLEEMGFNLREMIPAMLGGRSKKRPMRVDEALDYLVQEEEHKLIDMEQVTGWRSSAWSRAASFFWTRSIRSRAGKADTVPM